MQPTRSVPVCSLLTLESFRMAFVPVTCNLVITIIEVIVVRCYLCTSQRRSKANTYEKKQCSYYCFLTFHHGASHQIYPSLPRDCAAVEHVKNGASGGRDGFQDSQATSPPGASAVSSHSGRVGRQYRWMLM